MNLFVSLVTLVDGSLSRIMFFKAKNKIHRMTKKTGCIEIVIKIPNQKVDRVTNGSFTTFNNKVQQQV